MLSTFALNGKKLLASLSQTPSSSLQNVSDRSRDEIDSSVAHSSALEEEPPRNVAGCVRQLVKPPLRASDNSVEACDVSAAESASAWLASACESEASRSTLIQVMNEARVGEVAVPRETFDALCQVFVTALTCCDAQRDVKNARQFMIMSETYKRQPSSSNSSDTGAKVSSTVQSQGELYVAQTSAVSGHVLWSRRWFWEELMLFGVAGQFELCPQSAPWNTLQPDQLHDEVVNLELGRLLRREKGL